MSRSPLKRQRRAPKVKRQPGIASRHNALFKTAFHNSPAVQSILRLPDTVLVEINERFTKVLGYAREEVIGKTPFELNFWVFPQKLPVYRDLLEKQGMVRDFEVEVRAKDGSTRTMLLSSDLVEIDGVPHSISAGVDITARKDAEAKLRESERQLRESEARFSAAFRTSPIHMTIARLADGKFVEVNPAFLQMFGFERDEIIGRDSVELGLWVAPKDRADFYGKLKQGVVRNLEYQVQARGGAVHTLQLSGEVIEINCEPHLIVFGLDITDRKLAEQALRESEARFSTAFHASPVIMTIGRLRDEKLVEVNDAFVRLLGIPRDYIIGRDTKELDIWVDLDERRQFYEMIRRDRVLRNVECRIRSQDGQVHAMQISGEIIEINREPHLITFAVDITQRKQAEQVLRDAEARVRALYESLSAAAMVHDETGFLQINSACVKLFGAKQPEEIVGKHPGEVSPPVQPDGEPSFAAAQRHMARALAEGTHRFEWVCRKLDGTDFPVEVTLTALQLAGRRVMQAVVLDLTERKRAEVELQNALEKERELNQLKSDFVSLVSHEFRTPLEIIMSSADNLQRYHDRLAVEKREQLLNTIHKSVRRMAGMMEEVLVLGRLETGRMTFKAAAFDLRTFCQRVCDEIESATSKRCPIRLWVKGAPEEAVGDESVLRHIFTNLLSNAVKYSPPGRAVDLIVEREGNAAVCRIVDTGCGIPQADQKRLFQAFHRGSNVRQIPGTGLGLLIVQRCVELHGGEVRCESGEGEGTTFTVKLPLFAPALTHTLTPTPASLQAVNPRSAGE